MHQWPPVTFVVTHTGGNDLALPPSLARPPCLRHEVVVLITQDVPHPTRVLRLPMDNEVLVALHDAATFGHDDGVPPARLQDLPMVDAAVGV